VDRRRKISTATFGIDFCDKPAKCPVVVLNDFFQGGPNSFIQGKTDLMAGNDDRAGNGTVHRIAPRWICQIAEW
jgi:hypothetical protein